MHIVHLNSWSSLGQRTSDPHVIHFPVAISLLPDDDPFLCVLVCGLLSWGIGPASSSGSESVSFRASALDFFFLLENSEGKGLLMERVWRGLLGFCGCKPSSEELEPTSI